MTRYAENTTVSSEKSRGEIERTLSRYGASSFGYFWESDKAVVMFAMQGKQIRFRLPLPDKKAKEFTHFTRGRVDPVRIPRTPAAAEAAWEQASRQRWRALGLAIKAKLESVESGISTFESEFLANIMLPNGHTVGETIMPEIDQAYQSGRMPRTFLALEAPKE